MIASTLSYVKDMLNEYLGNTYGLRENVIVLSNITDQDGSIAVQEKNKIIMSLVSLEELSTNKNVKYSPKDTSHSQQLKPTLHLNCNIIFAAYFNGTENYKTGLKYLSWILSYFHSNPVLTKTNAPGLDPAIAKLTFELSNLSFEQSNHMWSSIGARYMPSVVYTMSNLPFEDTMMKESRPTITSLDIKAEPQN